MEDLRAAASAERDDDLAAVVCALHDLRDSMETMQRLRGDALQHVHPENVSSAVNMLHYLALRQQDIRTLQHQLVRLGLSSLGRAEAHVAATIDAVLMQLNRHLDAAVSLRTLPSAPSFGAGLGTLERNTRGLLGPRPENRAVRIMVTVSGAELQHEGNLAQMISQGMDCVRINCGRDNPEVWKRIVTSARETSAALARPLQILMDLSGPKLRTGPVSAAAAVLRCKPSRDDLGKVVQPAELLLVTGENQTEAGNELLPRLVVGSNLLARLRPGDALGVVDARGSRRRLLVTGRHGHGWRAVVQKTCYFTPGLQLKLMRKYAGRSREIGFHPLLAVLSVQPAIPLVAGQRLVLTREALPGKPAQRDGSGRIVADAHISCGAPEVFQYVRAGERILFDDGRMGGVVRNVGSDHLDVDLVDVPGGSGRLKAERGINFPDSDLGLPALSSRDFEDLKFAVQHADMVGLSFVRSPADVRMLQNALRKLGRPDMGIVLKIETRAGFEALPELLLAAMASPSTGVMIARGDLAVECGYQRMAELQEEILWLCESAHVPVIWATQVLEGLARTSLPTRAEITDAAMGERAECVMLNKGAHIVDAIRTLDDILSRMQGHQRKKSATLRRLKAWDHPMKRQTDQPQSLAMRG
jgi:pyruvate kinase